MYNTSLDIKKQLIAEKRKTGIFIGDPRSEKSCLQQRALIASTVYLCKNKIESEESSDEEVVSFTRRIINRISSNSDSDEESYANEDLEEMLEELAITEEEESTNAGDSLDNN
ncbi:hypothetical protein WN51_07950 [Melipona quadrifasciata]|uniref:Uncharacterized protein n=1 Tax=Melipona quadrifasciata TaxID=166423 RepID=A0A0N1IT03_9HYME|nr:hypothetical protein WN51_07950 [Melipona quadrifasciata]